MKAVNSDEGQSFKNGMPGFLVFYLSASGEPWWYFEQKGDVMRFKR